MLCLASAHALVRLDYGTLVGDTMEKTAVEALNWVLIFSDKVTLAHPQAATALKPTIRCQFLSSALKCMSTVSILKISGDRAFTNQLLSTKENLPKLEYYQSVSSYKAVFQAFTGKWCLYNFFEIYFLFLRPVWPDWRLHKSCYV